MKKLSLIFLGLFLINPIVKAQMRYDPYAPNAPTETQKETKMNPDGYVGGFTFCFEPGFQFANGSSEEDNEGTYKPYIPQFISQDIRIRNPFIKTSILFPITSNSTLFLNTGISFYKETYKKNDYVFFKEASLKEFTISIGIKLYSKTF